MYNLCCPGIRLLIYRWWTNQNKKGVMYWGVFIYLFLFILLTWLGLLKKGCIYILMCVWGFFFPLDNSTPIHRTH